MFEKDAEEYAGNTYEMCSYSGLPYASDRRAREQAFKDGAEFGYNKANEWHYVKDGDFPKDNNEKLCFYRKGTVVARYDSEYDCWETYFNNLETVIPSSVIVAWKEIVPPKEIE